LFDCPYEAQVGWVNNEYHFQLVELLNV
jgi:hypothetical protein